VSCEADERTNKRKEKRGKRKEEREKRKEGDAEDVNC
jgi:hypothetical protein